MIRKERFAFGAALVASALAFILSKSLAWLVLIIGLGLIFDFYLRGLIWGSDRLTREEIDAIPAEEYKKRVLGNFKTERWVNWRLSGYDAFKKQMRRLARQVVIFMLITPCLAFGGRFGFLYHEAHKVTESVKLTNEIDISAGLVPKTPQDSIEGLPPGSIVKPIQHPSKKVSDIPPPPPGFTPVQPPGPVISENDPWQVVSVTPASISELLQLSIPYGTWGALAGLALWVLYRAIVFAIRG